MNQNLESQSSTQNLIDLVLADLVNDLQTDGSNTESAPRFTCHCADCK